MPAEYTMPGMTVIGSNYTSPGMTTIGTVPAFTPPAMLDFRSTLRQSGGAYAGRPTRTALPYRPRVKNLAAGGLGHINITSGSLADIDPFQQRFAKTGVLNSGQRQVASEFSKLAGRVRAGTDYVDSGAALSKTAATATASTDVSGVMGPNISRSRLAFRRGMAWWGRRSTLGKFGIVGAAGLGIGALQGNTTGALIGGGIGGALGAGLGKLISNRSVMASAAGQFAAKRGLYKFTGAKSAAKKLGLLGMAAGMLIGGSMDSNKGVNSFRGLR